MRQIFALKIDEKRVVVFRNKRGFPKDTNDDEIYRIQLLKRYFILKEIPSCAELEISLIVYNIMQIHNQITCYAASHQRNFMWWKIHIICLKISHAWNKIETKHSGVAVGFCFLIRSIKPPNERFLKNMHRFVPSSWIFAFQSGLICRKYLLFQVEIPVQQTISTSSVRFARHRFSEWIHWFCIGLRRCYCIHFLFFVW